MVAKDVYVELVEEEYGKGPAILKKIDPVVIPPSSIARDLYSMFLGEEPLEALAIVKKAALYTKGEVRSGVEELSERKVIISAGNRFTYRLNPKRQTQADATYVSKLDAALTTV